MTPPYLPPVIIHALVNLETFRIVDLKLEASFSFIEKSVAAPVTETEMEKRMVSGLDVRKR